MQNLNGLLSRYWWAIALRGVIAILFGVIAFVWPGVTLRVILLLFGAYALVDGIAGFILGIREYGDRERWWATLLGGIVGIGAGLVTLIMPGITALSILLVIAVWAIMRGVLDILAAIRLRHVIEGEWLLALSGVLSIVFGIFLVRFPGAGVLAAVWWIGAYAVVLGALLVVLAFRLRGLARTIGA